jgi:hypothetical protein
VVAPWLVTLFLYNASVFVDVLSWSALLAMGFINFFVPPLLYLKAIELYPDESMHALKRNTLAEPLVGGAGARSGRPTLCPVIEGEEGEAGDGISPDFAERGGALPSAEPEVEEPLVDAVPAWVAEYVSQKNVAYITMGVMTVLTVATILMDFIFLAKGKDLVDGR